MGYQSWVTRSGLQFGAIFVPPYHSFIKRPKTVHMDAFRDEGFVTDIHSFIIVNFYYPVGSLKFGYEFLAVAICDDSYV